MSIMNRFVPWALAISYTVGMGAIAHRPGLGSIATAAPLLVAQTQQYQPGETVYIKHSSGVWYLGTVQGYDSATGTYKVVFAHQGRSTVESFPASSILSKAEAMKLRISDGEPIANTQPAPKAQEFAGSYRLIPRLWEGQNRCLEGNGPGGSAMGGMTFMDTCQNVTGQIWKLLPTGNGYYRLTTQNWEGKRCLEGNGPGGSLGGGAFMDTCQNVTGQMWKLIPTGNGYYRLTTQNWDGKRCLEGNGPGGSMGGVSFMDTCQNVTGQLWKLAPLQ